MESNDIQRLLNLNKQVTEGNVRPSAPQTPQYMTSGADISSLDEAVYGEYVPTEDDNAPRGWDSKEAYNKMKSGNMQPRQGIKESKIPAAILQSVLSNPLNDLTVEDDVERLVNNMGIIPENIQAALDINKRMDKQSQRQPLNEDYTPRPSSPSANIDMTALEEMIERVLDKKLGQMKSSLLNESKSLSMDSIKGFKINENGKFFFLASNDDLYECQMKYLGKNKKKKQ